MASSLSEFTQKLEHATQGFVIKSIVLEFAQFLGFSSCIYGGRFPLPGSEPQHVSLGNFSQSWRTLYEQREFLRIDPIARHAFVSPLPVIWDEVPRSTPQEIEFFELAAQHGLVHGAASPAMGRKGDIGMFSVARVEAISADPAIRLSLKQDLMMFTSVLHLAVQRLELYRMESAAARETLTRREIEVLSLAAENMTSAKIGLKLGIEERTVLFHIDMASKKFGVRGRHPTIDCAIATGELQLDERVLAAYRSLPKTRDLG